MSGTRDWREDGRMITANADTRLTILPLHLADASVAEVRRVLLCPVTHITGKAAYDE
jgi:hypothetical protein